MSKAAIETKKFATETKQIMELFAKWLYRDRDIFLRELISNAADAQDKLKTLALADDSLYADDHDLKIWILIDKDKKTITVRDNGVGMDYDEVVSHLGTIARSGTKQFLQSMQPKFALLQYLYLFGLQLQDAQPELLYSFQENKTFHLHK